MQTSVYNPLEPGFSENPFDQYERIRQGDRVQRTAFGPLLVHRYADCATLLRSAGTSVNAERAARVFGRPIGVPATGGTAGTTTGINDRRLPVGSAAAGRQIKGDNRLVILDPPDHTRIRRLFSRTFTGSRIERLRPRAQVLVNELLNELAAAARPGEPVDIVAGLASPLPFKIIVELLGLPGGDRTDLPVWAGTLASHFIEPFSQLSPEQIAEAGEGMSAFLGEAIEHKRANPADDLLSAMVTFEEDGHSLSPAEVLEQTNMLFVGGHETTVSFIGNSVVALMRQRDQLERLAADPDLDANAIDELLRWDAVQATRRITLEDVDIGDEVIPAGNLVISLLGAANRDPDHWGPSAGRIDLGRPDAGTHLSFGNGIHHCLGAALARLEATEAIPALVRRFPRMELAAPVGELPWRAGRAVIRGLDALPVVLEPA